MKNRSEEAERSEHDDLLLGIVHDMRAHLRSSLTNAQLLQRSALESLPIEVREQLDRIVSSNKDLDRLLSRISEFAGASHLSSGKTLTLDVALQSALLQFPSLPVELAPVSAWAAQQRIRQEHVRLFVELIDNALKFSANKPVRIEVSGGDDSSPALVTISDAGIGIDAADIDGAFEPLSRLNARDQFPGAGLGLAICRRIAGLTGATVELAPLPHGGAVATVILSNV
ncbi:MAG: HAMP domain-containing sensor histidine kinase [Acidobacteriota bacterium]